MKYLSTATVLFCLLALCSAPAFAIDDHGDTCATATAMTADGTSVAAIVDPVTDEDWLSFSAVAGSRYEATTFIASASFYYQIEVLAPDCATVLANWGYYDPDEHSIVPPTTDTYYVRIASLSSAYVGYVELGLTDQGAAVDDHNGRQPGATPIATDGTALSGTTHYVGDQDWFQFVGTGQHLYRMEVRAMPSVEGSYARAEIYQGIYSPAATGWSYAPPGGPEGEWVSASYYIPAGADGDYHVRVTGDGNGPFEVRVTDVASGAVDVHGDNCGAATAIPTDGVVNSIIIDPGTDEDWLSLACDAGNRYELTTFLLAGLSYLRVELIDPDCATVLTQWSYAVPNEYGFFAPLTGTYYLRTVSASGVEVGHLSLGVTDRGPQADDHSGYQAAATAAPVDGTVQNGVIDYPGDYDYFSFVAVPENLYSVQVRALTHLTSSYAATVLFDGPYQLDFSDYSIGGPNGDGPWTGFVYGAPAAGGTYYVLVYGTGDAGGSYELTITDLGPTPADEHGDDAASATPLTTDGTPISGVFGAGSDHDWFRFTTVPQRVYAVEVKALLSPDAGLAGGNLYAPDATSYLGFTGWSSGGPTEDGQWARVLYYVPENSAGDYYVDVLPYSFSAGNYEVRVILGLGLPGDFDGDLVPDADDNCVTVPNPDQADSDEDGIGDCCDADSPDQDDDDIANTCDNCPIVYNPAQADSDADGIGDACETQTCCRGDFNNDQQFNTLDIQGFVDALLAGESCQ
ncbi:MAG TPA: thrombospondin type 3 repeat-containing protein [Phycisphaerae bacterium]|nr:thrombospondin type 3 repeat-containing protein [Phycisphaerae bacterium]